MEARILRLESWHNACSRERDEGPAEVGPPWTGDDHDEEITVATDQHQIDEIRRQMAQIRRELHEDMQAVVAGAEAASDWKYYVQRYPWVALGLVTVAGYLVVPRRRTSATETAEAAATETAERLGGLFRRARKTVSRGVESQDHEPTPTEKKERKAGLIGMVFGMVSPVVLRVAQSYAANYAENWLAQQQATGLGPMSAGGPASGVGPRTGPAQAARPGPRPGSGPVPGAGKPPGGPSRPV